MICARGLLAFSETLKALKYKARRDVTENSQARGNENRGVYLQITCNNCKDCNVKARTPERGRAEMAGAAAGWVAGSCPRVRLGAAGCVRVQPLRDGWRMGASCQKSSEPLTYFARIHGTMNEE